MITAYRGRGDFYDATQRTTEGDCFKIVSFDEVLNETLKFNLQLLLTSHRKCVPVLSIELNNINYHSRNPRCGLL